MSGQTWNSTQSLILQSFIEHVLCARHCTADPKHKREYDTAWAFKELIMHLIRSVCKQIFTDNLILPWLPYSDFHHWSTQRKTWRNSRHWSFTFPSSPMGNPTIYMQSLMGREKNLDNPSFYVKAHSEEGNQQRRNEIEETLKITVLNRKIKGKITGKY